MSAGVGPGRYAALGRELQRYSSLGGKVGTIGVAGGETTFLSEQPLQDVLSFVRRTPREALGRYVIFSVPQIVPGGRAEFMQTLELIRRTLDADDESRILPVIAIAHRALIKHQFREEIIHIADFVFDTPLVILQKLNERTSETLDKIERAVWGLDLRDAELSRDRTKALASLRLNIQGIADKAARAGQPLRLIVGPRRFPTELAVLAMTTGADFVIDKDQYTMMIRCRYFAVARYFYVLAKAAEDGAAVEYRRLTMRYLLGLDGEISPERQKKAAKLLRRGGPWSDPEYAGLLPLERGQTARRRIAEISAAADAVVRGIGRRSTQIVGSLASHFRDLVPKDIDVVVALSDAEDFPAVLARLVLALGAGKARLETKNPQKTARLTYAEPGAAPIGIDVFLVKSLDSMEAQSRILSSVENAFYRGLAKERGFHMSDAYLETEPGHRVYDIRDALKLLGVSGHPGIDPVDLRDWYYGLTSF